MQNIENTLTLLCVEDNKTTQILYESIFEDEVKEIIFADDGLEGYAKYKEHAVDIIFSDYNMPNANGLEMIAQIREENKEIPIVLVSAIDDTKVITKALQLSVNNFVPKPVDAKKMREALLSVSKILIANRVLEEQRNREISELKRKEKYSSYQEELAFSKELNILRNDFYYKMVGDTLTKNISLVSFMYQPLDVMSGDAYSVRKIDEHRTFYLLVDGMGKGLSASLSAMLMTAFVNYLIDTMIEKNSFSFQKLIEESMKYIRTVLLDEEALAIDYILFDNHDDVMRYAKFAMPAFLLQNKDDQIVKIKSNNPPMSKWQSDFRMNEYSIRGIEKFLFFSDGIVENSVHEEGLTYAQFIEEDFKNSFTKEELTEKILQRVSAQEDDFTMIFINKLNCNNTLVGSQVFETALDDVEAAGEWYSDVWKSVAGGTEYSYDVEVVFTELFMNAYEHGNLNINTLEKHQMIENDTYIESLLEKEQECDKKIYVALHRLEDISSTYIVTHITDEGEGFDTQILSDIFRHSQTFNGRGVFVSRKNAMGIYYNDKGNTVLYLNKI